MDARELRIGNLVFDEDGDIGVVYLIAEIFVGQRFKNGNQFSQDYEFLKPIPLTEEWLIKFGFTKEEDDGDMKYYSRVLNDDWLIIFDHEQIRFDFRKRSGSHIVFYDDKHFQFIHQLQNLYYALTGTELTTTTK